MLCWRFGRPRESIVNLEKRLSPHDSGSYYAIRTTYYCLLPRRFSPTRSSPECPHSLAGGWWLVAGSSVFVRPVCVQTNDRSCNL